MATENQEVGKLKQREVAERPVRPSEYPAPKERWLKLVGVEKPGEVTPVDPETIPNMEVEFQRRAYSWLFNTHSNPSIEFAKGAPSYRRLRELGPPIIPMITDMFKETNPSVPQCVQTIIKDRQPQPERWLDLLHDIAMDSPRDLDVYHDELPKTMPEWIDWSQERFSR